MWFLPPLEEPDSQFLSPYPNPEPRLLFDPLRWRAAQAALSSELASLTFYFGALDERLRSGPRGWRQRLALLETADLSWWAGDRIDPERLALWHGMRLSGVLDDSQSLARAGWAMRRLTNGPCPDEGGWINGAAAFLGRGQVTAPEHAGDIEDLADVMATVSDLHRVTQAAILFHAWRKVGQGPSCDIEAAVMAARLGARIGRGGAISLPLALSGSRGLRGSGSELDRLASWIEGAERAVLASLLHLDRLADWERRTIAALSGQQGRTPLQLVRVFADWPLISAPMAEAQIGASRASIQRNLDLMEARGLIREITGQGRYRVWTAALV